MDSQPFLFFLHIPKNAGTTLRSILDCQYGRRAVLTYYNQPNRHLLDNLPYMLADLKRDYRALVGHYEFGPHKKLAKPTRYVTVLRDPVRRAVSAYYENLRNHPDKLTGPDGAILPIEEVLERDPGEYQNAQVKMLTNAPGASDLGQEAFDQARTNIETHFELAGLSERFVESMLLLGKRLGWRPCLWGRLNPGPPNPSASDRALERLRAVNAIDRMLFDWANAALDNAISAEGAAFADALGEITAALETRAKAGRERLEAQIVPDSELPLVAAYWGSRTPAPTAQR